MTDYLELYQSLEASLGQLGREIPLPMSGFARLHKKTMEDGELSRKVKELMALAISMPVVKVVLPTTHMTPCRLEPTGRSSLKPSPWEL